MCSPDDTYETTQECRIVDVHSRKFLSPIKCPFLLGVSASLCIYSVLSVVWRMRKLCILNENTHRTIRSVYNEERETSYRVSKCT